jgi:hypothetical protein
MGARTDHNTSIPINSQPTARKRRSVLPARRRRHPDDAVKAARGPRVLARCTFSSSRCLCSQIALASLCPTGAFSVDAVSGKLAYSVVFWKTPEVRPRQLVATVAAETRSKSNPSRPNLVKRRSAESQA